VIRSPDIVPTLASLRWIFAGLVLACAACPAPEPEPEPWVQPAPWEELSFDERELFMTWIFQPRMKAIFQERDAVAYDSFDCETCHGEEPAANDYAMPAAIEPLTFDDLPVDGIDDPERLALALWMEDVVLPEMAAMFEQPMTLEGASCLDCHPFE